MSNNETNGVNITIQELQLLTNNIQGLLIEHIKEENKRQAEQERKLRS